MDMDGVRARLREACKAAGTAKAWAARHGCSAVYVSDVMNGRKDPGNAILGPLGLQKIVRYVPKQTEATTGVQFGDPSPVAGQNATRQGGAITHGQ